MRFAGSVNSDKIIWTWKKVFCKVPSSLQDATVPVGFLCCGDDDTHDATRIGGVGSNDGHASLRAMCEAKELGGNVEVRALLIVSLAALLAALAAQLAALLAASVACVANCVVGGASGGAQPHSHGTQLTHMMWKSFFVALRQ